MKFIVDQNYFALADSISQAIYQENGLIIYFKDTSTKLFKDINQQAIEDLIKFLNLTDEQALLMTGGLSFDFRRYR